MTDINYATSLVITHVNLFEAVMEKFLHSESVFDNFQFGFKPDLLTSLCTLSPF